MGAPIRSAVRVPQRKLSDYVVAMLRQDILSGAYAPGDRLPTEAELCEQMGVSRSVMRDALRTLSSVGLISVRHGIGIEVAEPNADAVTMAVILLLGRSDLTMGDLVEARKFIEAALAPLAAVNGTDEDRSAMRGALQRFQDAAAAGDARACERAHREFHLGLLRGARLPALDVVLRPMQHVIALSSLPPRLDDMLHWDVEVHVPIVEALERRDPDAAHTATIEHFRFIDRKEHAAFKATPFDAARTLEMYEDLLGERP